MRQYDIWIDNEHRLPKTFLSDADTWKPACVLQFDEDINVFEGYNLPNLGHITIQLTEVELTQEPRMSIVVPGNLRVSLDHLNAHDRHDWALTSDEPFHITWGVTYWFFHIFNHEIMRFRAELNDFPCVCALLNIDNIEDVWKVRIRTRLHHRGLVEKVQELNDLKMHQAPPRTLGLEAAIRFAYRELKKIESAQKSVANLRRREEGLGNTRRTQR